MSAALAGLATIGALLDAAAAYLAGAGIAEPRREARLILGLALGIEPAAVLGWPERAVEPAAATAVEALTARRARGEPFSRLKGSREFWSLDFALSPDTLDPRADSETLIAAALADIRDLSTRLRIVDFGTGTGCLLLALLSELPRSTGIGVDIAPGAIATARANATALGLATRAEFRLGGWDKRIDGAADVILANPPYIPSCEIADLPREVSGYDPRMALDGGVDGLSAYRSLGAAIRDLLTPSGRAYIETGTGQAGQVTEVLFGAGLRVAAVKSDLAGIQRCLIATL